jgi:hypothetical protein
MTGAEGLNNSAYLTQLFAPASSLTAAGGLTGAEGAGGASQSSATQSSATQSSANISSLGQILAGLQQLQAQNPTAASQLAAQIAGQLQGAAQQQGSTGPGQSLSNLAAQFQGFAGSGDISKLQQSVQGHHHGHHATYNGSGQPTTSTSSTTDPAGGSLQQLFTSIASEVSQALGS